VQEYILRDGGFRDELGLTPFPSATRPQFRPTLSAASQGRFKNVTFATFTVIHREDLSISAEHELCIDFLAHAPREHVVYFGGSPSIGSVRGAVAGVPKLRELHLVGRMLDLQPNLGGRLANEKPFPSLRHLYLEDALLYEDTSSPALPIKLLAASGFCRRSLGNLGASVKMCCGMKGLVEELVLDLIFDDDCSLDHCLVSEAGE